MKLQLDSVKDRNAPEIYRYTTLKKILSALHFFYKVTFRIVQLT